MTRNTPQSVSLAARVSRGLHSPYIGVPIDGGAGGPALALMDVALFSDKVVC